MKVPRSALFVLLGAAVGLGLLHLMHASATSETTTQDVVMDVWFLDDGKRVQGFSFLWEPAGPVQALNLKPLAFSADKDRYGRGNPGIEVYLRGRVEVPRGSDLAENRVDVTANVAYVAPDGTQGTTSATTSLDETGWEDSSDHFGESFKFHWDPLISGPALVCANERGGKTVNLTAHVRADANGRNGPMWGEASTAMDVSYSCSKNDAGLNMVLHPTTAVSFTGGSYKALALAPTYLGPAPEAP